MHIKYNEILDLSQQLLYNSLNIQHIERIKFMNKKAQVSANTKKSFMDALCCICRQKSIENITIQEITRKAGYNRCTFYQYFQDIYELLNHIEDMIIKEIEDFIQINTSNDDFIKNFIEAFTKIREGHIIYLELLLNHSSNVRFINKLKKAFSPILFQKLNISENELLSQYIVEIYFHTILATIACWIENKRNLPTDDILNIVSNTLNKGIMSNIKRM